MLSTVLAHSGEPPAPHDLWLAWNLDPLVLVALGVAVWAYRRGCARSMRPTDRWRVWSFAGAVAAVAVAVVSPLDALSGALASAHMVQHVVLVLVAAPLLALSAPSAMLLRGSPLVVRRSAGRWRRRLALGRAGRAAVHQPTALWLAHVATLWFWHASVPYGAALDSRLLHAVEHGTFLATGVLFWRVVIGGRVRDRVSGAVGVLLVFAMALQSVFLSALLTFARQPWYDAYAGTTEAWGLTPLADQQLAGVIMWVPAGLVYLAAGLGLLITLVNTSAVDAEPARTVATTARPRPS